jgi:hypothetical protein
MNWHRVKTIGRWGALAIAALFCGPSQAQLNGIINPDFENDIDNGGIPDYWFQGGSIGYVLTDDSDGVGTHSVSAQLTGHWRSFAFPVAPGQKLTYSLDYKVSQGATGSIRTELRFFNGYSGGGTSGALQGEFTPDTDVGTVPQGVWNTLGPFTVTVPAGKMPPMIVPRWGDVRLSAGIFGPVLRGTVQFDNLRVIIPEPATISLALILVAFCGAFVRRPRAA